MDSYQSLYESLAASFPQVGPGNKKMITFQCSTNIKLFIEPILRNIEMRKINFLNDIYSVGIVVNSVQALALSTKLVSMGAHKIVVQDLET